MMMNNNLINNENKTDFTIEKLQNTSQFVNSMMSAGPFTNTNPYTMMQLEQFPDILQNYSTEQSKMLFDILIQSNNLTLISKSGALGGYTALHWMCIKNEYELIEYLIEKFKVDINCKASMGETPLLIAIK
jgi:ankyrin repeat protein